MCFILRRMLQWQVISVFLTEFQWSALRLCSDILSHLGTVSAVLVHQDLILSTPWCCGHYNPSRVFIVNNYSLFIRFWSCSQGSNTLNPFPNIVKHLQWVFVNAMKPALFTSIWIILLLAHFFTVQYSAILCGHHKAITPSLYRMNSGDQPPHRIWAPLVVHKKDARFLKKTDQSVFKVKRASFTCIQHPHYVTGIFLDFHVGFTGRLLNTDLGAGTAWASPPSPCLWWPGCTGTCCSAPWT